FAADVLDRRAHRMANWRYTMGPILVAFGTVAALVMFQPDMGTTMILACIVLASLYVAGSPLGPMAGVLGLGGALTMLMAVAAPYRWRRVMTFLHPFADATNSGYQS